LKSFNVFVFQRVYFFFFLGRGSLQTGVHANSAAKNFVWEGPIKLTDVVLSPTIPSNYFPTAKN